MKKYTILLFILMLGITTTVASRDYTMQTGNDNVPISRAEDIADDNDSQTQWLMAPTIVVEGENVMIIGPDADLVNSVYANDTKLKVSKGIASLDAIEDSVITINATLSNGVLLTRIINRQ